jgi:hypothetical protein
MNDRCEEKECGYEQTSLKLTVHDEHEAFWAIH